MSQDMRPRLVVVGVGGAGGNAVNNMIGNVEGAVFIVCNTDAQALTNSKAEIKIQLGARLTKGLGAGMRPEIGAAAVEESLDEILEHLKDADMVFITAGMGGGTGTGGSTVIARAARDMGILTVGVVTKPFSFEGKKRMDIAEKGIAEFHDATDTILIIPNQNLFRVASEDTSFLDAFRMADDVLCSAVRTFTDLMTKHGLINLDFADISSVMKEMLGGAMMGTGEASGDNRAVEASEIAVACPLLDNISIEGAQNLLINITGGHDLKLFEVDAAVNFITAMAGGNAKVIFGTVFDQEMNGKIRVSFVATGIETAADTSLPTNSLARPSEKNAQNDLFDRESKQVDFSKFNLDYDDLASNASSDRGLKHNTAKASQNGNDYFEYSQNDSFNKAAVAMEDEDDFSYNESNANVQPQQSKVSFFDRITGRAQQKKADNDAKNTKHHINKKIPDFLK
jgi:cell division protein FtsZ